MRLTIILLLSLIGPILSGCETSQPPLTTAEISAESHEIPFTAASVQRRDGSYDISWASPADAVAVYAVTRHLGGTREQLVGSGAGSGKLAVSGLPEDRRWYFELVPARGASLVIADSSVRLANAPNFRDIGGYRTGDGRWVKMGLLFRSDQLNLLNDAELETFASLGIATVADLRTERERTQEPDRYPAGTRHQVMDVMRDGGAGGDLERVRSLIAEGRAGNLMLDGGRKFVGSPSAITAYSTLLRIVEEQQGNTATLFHCTAGKDRTGWAAAAILTVLGVPRETVIADYLASNDALAEKNERAYAAIAKERAQPLTLVREQFAPFMGVRREYLEASFNEVEQLFGSFDNYAEQALGLDAVAIERLRNAYLSGTPTVIE